MRWPTWPKPWTRTSKTLPQASGSTAASVPSFCAQGWDTAAPAFPKDVAAFHWVAQERGVDFQLLEEVRKINDTQREVFFNKVRSALWTLRGKRLAALGLAFKGDTDDIRDSPAIDLIQKLLQAGAIVTAYDPAAMERAKEVLPPAEKMRYASDLYEAAKDADAVLILTDWKEFANIDLARLNRAVRFPIVIDGRNLYKPQQMQDHGFTYVSVGRPANYKRSRVSPRRYCFKGMDAGTRSLRPATLQTISPRHSPAFALWSWRRGRVVFARPCPADGCYPFVSRHRSPFVQILGQSFQPPTAPGARPDGNGRVLRLRFSG